MAGRTPSPHRLRSSSRWLATVGAGSALLLVPAPASAAASSYVALGDSYSSGTGTRSYLNDGTSCQRSVYAFPSLVASSRGYALDFRACSGATTADVTRTQLSALTATTSYVSISVGGNDAGFVDVLTECALPAWVSNCNGAIDSALRTVNDVLPTRLDQLYASARARSPRAKVVVAGYPRIFNGEDCNALTWFSPSEEARLNGVADVLNSRLSAAAGRAGFTFAGPTTAFVGHAVCDSPEWLNGLSSPITESYHPNRAGHASGYAPLVSSRLTGAAVRVDARTLSRAAASAPQLAAQQQRYAAQDRAVRPETFVAPDLDSPRVRAAAARAGVDLSSRASIDAVDQAYAQAQATG